MLELHAAVVHGGAVRTGRVAVIAGAELLDGRRPIAAHVSVYLFAVVPFVALLAVVPIAWGWVSLGWISGWAAACYTVTCSRASPSASTGTSRTARSRPGAGYG